MLNEEIIDNLTDVLVRRIEKVNTYTLKKIGEVLGDLRDLPPSQANDLAMIFKYGGDYDQIVKELAKVTEINEKDIEKIFKQVAKKNLAFAEQFYEYRDVKYIPYDKNIELQNQVRAIAKITKRTYRNLSKTTGFVKVVNGKKVFTPLAKAYRDTIDEGVTALIQGKDSFNSMLTKTIRQLSKSGIKTIDWASGYSRRLDSSVRMNLRGAIRDFSIELQQQFGEEYGADGVEVSVHENPEPDHEEVQGHQFSTVRPAKNKLSMFEKLQKEGRSFDYNGELIDIHGQLKSGELTDNFRPIGQLNCYHYVYSVILGISKPQYTAKQLEDIKKRNRKGFEMDGKHYTNYQGQQMQRSLETSIREQNDRRIMAEASGQEDEALLAQQAVTELTNKYFELSQKSGLPTKIERINFIRR